MKPTPREFLEAAARTHVPDDLNLYPRFAPRLERKTIRQSLRARPALLILFIVLALTLLTGVAYAVGRLTGFIPGFGFTGDTSSVYLLKAPAQIAFGGQTIRVENAVSTDEKFWIKLSLDGSQEIDPNSYVGVSVHLPDGTTIPDQAGQEDDRDSNPRSAIYEFPPLPAGTNSVAVRYETFTSDGTLLGGVDIPLELRPIETGEIIPALEVQRKLLQSETHDGVTLVLDNVAPASDKTLLQVSLRFDQPGTSLNANWNVTLIGEDGKIYPLTLVMSDSNNQSKTYETLPFRGDEQLTLGLTAFPDAENLPMSVDVPIGEATFTFDPGVNPQAGQSWNLDQQVQVGKYGVRVIGATLTSPNELLFEFAPTPGVTGAALYSPLARGGTGSLPVENSNFTAKLSFETTPSQPLTISITRVGYVARGQWQIHWQPASAPQGVMVGPTNTPVPTPATFVTPTITGSDPLLLEVQTLARKFETPLQQGAGWIHMVKETETIARPGQSYPPPYIANEQWLELDAEGNVIRSLWTDRDKDGNVVQQAVSIGNYFINFTTGESGHNEYSRYLFSIDLLTQDLVKAAEYQAQVTREEVSCEDGSPCLLVTLFDAFEQAVQHPEDAQAIIGMGRRTWVNLTTGQQVKLEAFSRFQDGTEKIEITERAMLIEKLASPPQDVLKIINGVVVP